MATDERILGSSANKRVREEFLELAFPILGIQRSHNNDQSSSISRALLIASMRLWTLSLA